MISTNDRPGMLTMLGSIVRAPFEERLVRVEAARYERLSHEAASSMLEQTVRLVQPEEDGYTQLLTGQGSSRDLDSTTSKELRTQAIRVT